jgi:hypothetical protein
VLVLVWIALALAVVAPAVALVSAARAGLRTWCDFRRLSRAAGAALSDLADRLERFAETAARTPKQGDDLQASLERLRLSRARLAVLRTAVDEATDAAGRVTVFYPRK